MSALDRRLHRLEADAKAAYWARVAALFTERLGRDITADECRTIVDQAHRDAAPYLARGMSMLAAYASMLGVSEATVVAEAESIAAALGD
jgi:hypothetical protein